MRSELSTTQRNGFALVIRDLVGFKRQAWMDRIEVKLEQ